MVQKVSFDTIRHDGPDSCLIMMSILKKFANESKRLYKGWNEQIYLGMEETRRMAMDNCHFLEEATILFFESQYLRNIHEDMFKIRTATERLKELQAVFDRDDDYFRQIYSNICQSTNDTARQSIDWCIKYMFDEIGNYANFFFSNLDIMTAILCGKAVLKIAAVSPEIISFDQIMEPLFFVAMNYGYICDYNSSFHYYNMAIDRARTAGDNTCLYIALLRKLSICMEMTQLDSQTDFDLERIDCVRILNDMMPEGVNDAEELGNMLVLEETSKKRKAVSGNEAYYQDRIDKIQEVMPMLPTLLAMARGDEATRDRHIERIEEAERCIYGGIPGFCNADLMSNFYSIRFDSPEREELEGDKTTDAVVQVDDEMFPDFPEGMTLCDKFIITLFNVWNFIFMKMFKSAENFCDYLLDMADKAKSDYHRAVALYEYGQLFKAQQQHTKSLEAYKRAIDLLENADLKTSDADMSPYLYFNILTEIGDIVKQENPESAVSYFTKAIDWHEKHNMPQMQFMFLIMNRRANAYQDLGQFDLADKDRTDFLRFAENETRRRVMMLDADSRDIFWGDTSWRIYSTVAHLRPDSSECFKVEAYNAVLLSKGLLLNSEKSVKEIAYGNPNLKQLYDELEENEHSRRKWGTSADNPHEEYTENYLKSMKLVSNIEKAIPENSGFLHIDIQDIIKALGENDVLVDFFDYETEDEDRQYIAFVLRQGTSVPDVVELCKESELSSFFEAQMAMGNAGKEVDFQTVYNPFLEESHRLEEMIWKPLEDYCKLLQSERIYFVPSGSLHKVAIESLPFRDSWDETLSDRYASFARLAHARTLLCPQERPANKTAAIFAAPDYGGDKANVESSHAKGYRVRMSDYNQEASEWPSLPRTKEEAEELQAIFGISGWTVDSFTGSGATAANFMDLDGDSPTVLHISTHGFAETKESAERIPALSSFHKPLDLTGIVLANGNEGWMKGTDGSHTGIVLASDIAKMDLSGSDIVFVSCCFSGEGIVKPDGIYGIQRALKKAGAQTVIMSLWAESEDSGKLFAKEFYRSYLYGNDKDAAFRRARKAVHKATDNPYLWAGFIMLD